MNTTTHIAKRLTSNLREYRQFSIIKAVKELSDRTIWIFRVGNRVYSTKTLKQAKVMIDYAIEHEGY